MTQRKHLHIIILLLAVVLFAGCGKATDAAVTAKPGSGGNESAISDTSDDSDTDHSNEPESNSNSDKTQTPDMDEAPPDDAKSGEADDTQNAAVALPDVLIKEDGSYTTKNDVALYLYAYGKLPQNFITKKEARALGWDGGSLEPYAPGKCIGGDRFGNYEGLLPEEDDYRECDIDTLGAKSRGAKRIVYSDDGDIYYTEDHYKNFTLLYESEQQ